MAEEATRAEYTPGPYFWREFVQAPEDLEQIRKLGMTLTRLLTNEGQVSLMAGEGHDVKRIALIDCQTNYKRGQGYKTECAERDANATLFAAAPELLAVCRALESHCRVETPETVGNPAAHAAEGKKLRARLQAAIALATPHPETAVSP